MDERRRTEVPSGASANPGARMDTSRRRNEFWWREILFGGLKTVTACLLCVAFVGAQAQRGGAAPAPPPAQKPEMAEDVLKNIQVLRGISMDEFMERWGFSLPALSLNCIDCHVQEAATDWAKYADDTAPEANCPQDGSDGQGHQSDQLRRQDRYNLLYLPSQQRYA